WEGEGARYPSQSEADMALVGILAFYTGWNIEQLERLIVRSGLYRDKWDRDDYRLATIEKVLDQMEKCYGMKTATANVEEVQNLEEVHQEAVNAPDRLARACMEEFGRDGDESKLRRWHGEWWLWEGKAYRRCSEEEIRHQITRVCKKEFDRARDWLHAEMET